MSRRAIKAARWLIGVFDGCDELNSCELWAQAKKEGLSTGSVIEAKELLGIKAKLKRCHKDSPKMHWTWKRPDKFPELPSEEEVKKETVSRRISAGPRKTEALERLSHSIDSLAEAIRGRQ